MSALWIGRRQSVGIGIESSRGTAVAASYWLNVMSFTFADKPVRAMSEASYGGIWAGDQAPLVLTKAEGEFEIEIGDASFGAILYALFGTKSVTGPTDVAAYTHAFTLSNSNQHPSLSVRTIDPIGDLLFKMSMIDKFTMKIEKDKIISATIGFISKASAISVGNTASYVAEKKFVGRNLAFKVADVVGSLAAASAVSLQSLTLTIEKNAEAQSTLGTVQPEDIVNKRFNITGEITLNYEDRTWLSYVTASGYKAISITLTHDDTITGAATTKYSFNMDLSKCVLEGWEPSYSMDDITTQKLNFTALYDAGVLNNICNSVTLVNGVTSYS